MILAATRVSAETVAPSSRRFKVSRLTIAYSLRLTFKKPRFGMRRNNSVCPPSKPGRTPPPERDF